MTVLRIERDGELATVVLNRPEALNALSNELCDAIVHAFRELAEEDGVRAVTERGALQRGRDRRLIGHVPARFLFCLARPLHDHLF